MKNNPIDFKKVYEIISNIDGDTFYTTDVLRDYLGQFLSDKNTPPSNSFNARFGKFLRQNEQALHIVHIDSGIRIKDDNGNPTKTSMWSKLKNSSAI